MTVSQSLYKMVQNEFKTGSTRISKSAILEWEVRYAENKKANGDTKARKLRKLVEEGYLNAIYEGGQCYIVPKGKGNEHMRNDEDIEKPEKQLPAKPVPMRRGSEKPIAVPPEAVANLLAHGWKKV